MTRRPVTFEYYLYQEALPVQQDTPFWGKRLPGTRRQAADPGATENTPSGLTVGEYFQAARRFFTHDGLSLLLQEVSRETGRNPPPNAVHTVRIGLKKHGAFYHPAKVSLLGDAFSRRFVLNVAFSDAGKRVLRREVRSLKHLRHRYPFSFVPRIYGTKTVPTAKGPVAMFLGEWFEGYHEFHLIPDSPGHPVTVCVWEGDRGDTVLDAVKTAALFRRVAHILAAYYDPVTFEAITHWHHASGDFVVKIDKGNVHVRLVTVRRYGPLFKSDLKERTPEPSAQNILHALLFFFLEVSCRIRLDREHGTGNWIWAGKGCLHPMTRGFFQALAEKGPVPALPAPLDDCFKAYLLSMTFKDVSDLLVELVTRRFPAGREAAFVLKHVPEHAQQLLEALADPL